MKRILTSILLSASSLAALAQWNADSTDLDTFSRFRFGGYGEAVASFKDYGINRFFGGNQGNARMRRNTIAVPRLVVGFDYKFNRHWSLSTEIEFESGGTGVAYEIENTENGEYETEVEKGGEVAVEQFHLTWRLNNAFAVRAGHMIVPVGQNNQHHEPIQYFGTVRPEGETSLIPNTWHETGLALLGQAGRRWFSFDWQAMVVAGLNANGFDRNHWLKGGKQGFFEEDNFTSPGYALRINYRGVPGLRLGASFYYCHNAGSNADKPENYSFEIPVRIWNVDAQYRNRWMTVRGSVLGGHLGNSTRLSARNGRLSSGSPYTRLTPVARQAVSCGVEAGLRLKGLTGCRRMPDLVPFARYEFYNPQHRVQTDRYSTTPADRRLKTSMWVAGLNYRPIPQVVVKADYTTRRLGDGAYNRENEFALGVAFTGWFIKK